ncbi:type III sulfide quinone reductase, selenoprotein subtype [Fodinibius saliphilus]|uniref:type III sulfide quinone reductase, selenoprotein subtype n=1 Tax=Fodinibius saliphilus TaxID=1920650 RepID=UPI001109AF85|nr:FAD/NAD(P)-binding oxidoreductase [Fodinibius saliphilus]
MKRLVILGGGTAGTMMANKLRKALSKKDWNITLVDKEPVHYYQPGFLFIPFGAYSEDDVVKPKRNFFPKGVEVVFAEIDRIEPEQNKVLLKGDKEIAYDYLIVATGTDIRPDEVEGMTGPLWHKSIFDFYTLEGSTALAEFLDDWEGGRLVLNIAEMPIKCPVAPLEFLFLADDYFKKKGIRDKVDITLATPLPGAFTKPVASSILGDSLRKRNINVEADFAIGEVNNEEKKIVSWDEREIPFDLLVTIPTNMGSEAIKRSGMGDEFNYIPTDKHTLQSKNWDNIFVIGDATDLPASKAGSVAHFEGDILFENFMDVINGGEPSASFDGHANCFIESGDGKGFLIDFNYDTEPLPGKFPLPGIGPFSLLEETAINHWGKLIFKWIYWNALVKGRELPIDSHMSMTGKKKPKELINQ